MKKFSKRVMAIVGTATLAVGLMALPALAGTTQKQGNGVGQHQALMNSSAMQNLYNSAETQKAIQTGNVKTMQELMNSNAAVKAQIGQDNLDKMNQFMSQSGRSMMRNGSGINGSRGTMMSGNSNK